MASHKLVAVVALSFGSFIAGAAFAQAPANDAPLASTSEKRVFSSCAPPRWFGLPT